MAMNIGDEEGAVAYQFPHRLYFMHFFFVCTSRMWEIGIVLLIAELSGNSLSLVALSGLTGNLFIILFMPHVGKFLDETNRLVASQIALMTKVTTLTVAYGLCAYLAYENHDPSVEGWLYAVPFLCALAALSFNAISQSVEKDWVVVLSAGDSRWLSRTNSMMTQIDSFVNALAPFFTGLLFSVCSHTVSAITLLVMNLGSAAFLYFYMKELYESWPALALRRRAQTRKTPQSEPSSAHPSPQTASSSSLWSGLLSYYDEFLSSGCAGAMIAYALLYCTVLSFGALMIVYLRYSGLSDSVIGTGRGLASVFALAGAASFPYLQQWLGLYLASQVSIYLQCALVVTAALAMMLLPLKVSVVYLIVAVLISRAGLWMFDLGVRQIAQETIPEHCRGKVNGQWRSLMAGCEMTIFLLAILIPDPQHFYILTSISALMVTTSAVLFTVYRPDRAGYEALNNDSRHGNDDSEDIDESREKKRGKKREKEEDSSDGGFSGGEYSGERDIEDESEEEEDEEEGFAQPEDYEVVYMQRVKRG